MKRDQEGDYGYDLAHEEVGRGQARDDPPGQADAGSSPVGDPSDRSEDSDRSDDFGYDEAHDF